MHQHNSGLTRSLLLLGCLQLSIRDGGYTVSAQLTQQDSHLEEIQLAHIMTSRDTRYLLCLPDSS